MFSINRLAVAIVGIGTVALGGRSADDEYSLPNSDFESGLAGWGQWASDATAPFLSAASPDGTGLAALCDLPAGVEARLELALPIGAGVGPAEAPEFGHPGEKVDFGAWFWLPERTGGGEVWLTLESFDGSSSTLLAESARIDPAVTPKGRWLFLQVRPDFATDARVQENSTALRYVLHSSVTGRVWFDSARAGRFEYAEYPLVNGSFEDGLPLEGAWRSEGLVGVNDPAIDPAGYYGTGHVRLEGLAGTSLSQEILVPNSPAPGSPLVRIASEVEAGCWLRPLEDTYFPPTPSPSVYVELSIFGVSTRSGTETLLASGRYHPTLDDRGHWRFLHTVPLEEILIEHDSLRVEVEKSFSSEVWIDFVQAGEVASIDGNPRRRVGCNYVGRYRSPLFPGCSTTPTASGEIWRNWHWTAPNACNPSFTGFFHDPECATSPDCIRTNGRRDLAISTLESIHDLPLVGSYDSRDRDVIRYHLDLARAVGIDHFIYEYLGHKLAAQNAAVGREPVNEEAWEALLEVAEEPGSDFKLAVMYEPKVHYLGWVQGEASEAEKLAGMIEDLTYHVERMRNRRCALRRDGRLVVFIFRNTICSPDGSQCLDDTDWLTVQAAVAAATGEELFLIGDVAPSSDSPFGGLSRWRLIRREILEYRTYDEAEAGTPSWPAPRLGALRTHSRAVHRLCRDWAAEADRERVAVGIVWPGFDDSGIGGWGSENLLGEDGEPLCVRIADDFGGRFYTTTVASAIEQNCDWIQIATWNDWNETTRIEPAWHPDYFPQPFPSSPHSGEVFNQVFDRLSETGTWITAFKGSKPRVSLERVATGYLLRAASDPGVVEYD
jgi:hypothetical protein